MTVLDWAWEGEYSNETNWIAKSVWGQSQWKIIKSRQDLQPHGHKGGDMKGGKSQHIFRTIFLTEKPICIHPFSSIHFKNFHFNFFENSMYLSASGVFNFCQSSRWQLCQKLSLTLSAKIKKTPASKNLRINLWIKFFQLYQNSHSNNNLWGVLLFWTCKWETVHFTLRLYKILMISVSVIAASKLLNYSANINSNICFEVGMVVGCGPIRKMKAKCLTYRYWLGHFHSYKIGLWMAYKRNELALIFVSHTQMHTHFLMCASYMLKWSYRWEWVHFIY